MSVINMTEGSPDGECNDQINENQIQRTVNQDEKMLGIRDSQMAEMSAASVAPLEMQVAGHGSEKGKKGGERGILECENGFILKPIQAPPKGERELAFYNHISSSTNPLDKELYSWMPQFNGTVQLSGIVAGNEFLLLENLCRGMEQPCVMDIKIGAQTYGPDATESKRLSEDAKYIGTKKPLGFSVTGMISRSRAAGGRRVRWDKSFGLGLNVSTTHQILANFFDCPSPNEASESCLAVVREFLRLLHRIRSLFRRQNRYRFYACSLLFVYDHAVLLKGSGPGDCRNESTNGRPVLVDDPASVGLVRLRMIDFAHVFRVEHRGCADVTNCQEGPNDANFLQGLNSLCQLFQQFVGDGWPISCCGAQNGTGVESSGKEVDRSCVNQWTQPPSDVDAVTNEAYVNMASKRGCLCDKTSCTSLHGTNISSYDSHSDVISNYFKSGSASHEDNGKCGRNNSCHQLENGGKIASCRQPHDSGSDTCESCCSEFADSSSSARSSLSWCLSDG